MRTEPPIREPARVLFHLDHGYTRVLLIRTEGTFCDIPTGKIPLRLRPIGSEILMVHPRFTPEPHDTPDDIRQMLRNLEVYPLKPVSMSDEIDPVAFAEGRITAERDLAAGILRYRRHGHPGPWGRDFEALMAERFHVQVEDSAGAPSCFINPRQVSFDSGYNEIILAEIARLHGPDAFSSLLEEAKTISQARHDKYLADRKKQ